MFGYGGDRVARAGRIQPMPGQGAKIGVELPAHHLRRGVRGIVLARRYPAAEDILRRLQPEAGEGKAQLPGDGLMAPRSYGLA